MRQASKPFKPPFVRLLRLGILWPVLLLLASFVFFFEFIADVGGSAGPLTSPLRSPSPPASPTPTADPFPDTSTLPLASVVEVIDGDTLVVRLDRRPRHLRYYGIDTPEPGERCFSEAKEANRQLVEGQAIRLLSDARDADEAGRLLRYVFLEDGRSVEASLVAQGLARAWREDGTYRDYFIGLEKAAQAKRVGCLWSR